MLFVYSASGTVTDQQGQSKANAAADAGTVGKAAQSNATESAGMDHLSWPKQSMPTLRKAKERM